MIYLYNETTKPQWDIVEKNNTFFRLENQTNKRFGIDFLKGDLSRESFNLDVLDTVNDVSLNTLFNGTTTVVFEKKALTPFIINGLNYNTDIIIATFDLSDGRRILNHRVRNGNVYSYMYDVNYGVFTIIFSLNTREDSPSIQEIFKDNENKMIFRRVIYFNGKNKEYGISYRALDIDRVPKQGEKGYININDESIDNGRNIKIRCYTPNRPTYTFILTNREKQDEVTDLLANKYKITENKHINLLILDNMETIRDTMKNLHEHDHIKAVTFYVDDYNTEQLRENIEEVVEDLINTKCGSYFNKVFAMANDGLISRIKV